MKPPDLSRIDKEIVIDAPPERVWRALSDPGELGEWFQVTIEGLLAPGADLWMTSLHPGYEGQRFQVRVVEMSAGRRLVWEWHPGQLDPAVDYSSEPPTTVTFDLEAHGGGTRLRLSETGFDRLALPRREPAFEDNERGWLEVLGWLRAHAERAR